MDNKLKKMAKEIVKINDKTRSKPQPYDTSGVVQRVKDGVAYIKFQGAEDETPVDMTINCKPGDNVKVRISNRRAWVTGNATAPPTDDKQAYVAQAQAVQAENKANIAETEAKVAQETANIAEKEATNAASTAETARQISYDTAQYFWNKSEGGTSDIPTGAYITEKPREEFEQNPSEGGGNLLARSDGIDIRDGSSVLSSFHAGNAKIGNPSNKHIEVSNNGIDFYYDDRYAPAGIDFDSENQFEDTSVNIHNSGLLGGNTISMESDGPTGSITIQCGNSSWAGGGSYIKMQADHLSGSSIIFSNSLYIRAGDKSYRIPLSAAGFIQLYAGDIIPSGWLLCDGRELRRIQYPYLYNAIGTTYGVGTQYNDGFLLPDLCGRVPVGYGSGTNLTPRTTMGDKFGSEYLQDHTHTVDYNVVYRQTATSGGGVRNCVSGGASVVPTNGVYNTTTGNSGNMQPSIVLKYIIFTG